MTKTVEEMRYQLEEWLSQGFTSSEDRANYQTLKEQYEDETFDYSFQGVKLLDSWKSSSQIVRMIFQA